MACPPGFREVDGACVLDMGVIGGSGGNAAIPEYFGDGEGLGAWTEEELALDRALTSLGMPGARGGNAGIFGDRAWQPDWMPDWLRDLLDAIAKLWDDIKKAADEAIRDGKRMLLWALLAVLAVVVISRR